jgi:hypothetical protein
MKSIRHYAVLCIEYVAISSIMVIRAGYKLPICPGGAWQWLLHFKSILVLSSVAEVLPIWNMEPVGKG